MKRMMGAVLLALLLLMTAQAAAAMQMQVYVAKDAMNEETAQQLVTLLNRAYPQAEWTLLHQADTERSLQALILADETPQLFVGTPGEVNIWAQEGLLASLEAVIADQERMQPQVISACMLDGHLFMAPLTAQHRQMAVNRQMMDREKLGYMLSTREHPVWYPTEIGQILEEFALSKQYAMEIWPPEPENCAAIEALIQAIYSGTLLTEDGQIGRIENGSLVAGLRWLQSMTACGLIGVAESREEALEHFLAGETAIYIDWTAREELLYAHELRDRGMELVTMPYPSSSGLPLRSFELTGLSVFMGNDMTQVMMGVRAAAYLSENIQAQLVLGDRFIWRDEAVWLPLMNANRTCTTLRKLLCVQLDRLLNDGITAEEALGMTAAAMEALGS